jgi:ABC-type multidrug transport system fused ATPase/permease subunit
MTLTRPSHEADYLAVPRKGSVIRLMIRLGRHLSRRRRGQLGLLGGLIVLTALSEVISLGALLPFLGILASPDRVMTHPTMVNILPAFSIATAEQLVLPLAVLFVLAVMISGGLRLLLAWATGRLAYGISADYSIEIYRRTLYQPYPVHVARNSSTVLSGIAHKVEGATKMQLCQLNLAKDAVLLLAVMSTLIALEPVVATLAGAGFGGSYGLASWLARRRLRRNGLRIAREQTNIIKVVQEGLGGIRDVLLGWTQPVYADVYTKASIELRRAAADTHFLSLAPRFVMETVGTVLVVGLAYWLSATSGGLGAALPVLGVMALGVQRALPLLQEAYQSWASATSSVGPVSDVLDLLDQPLPPEASLPAPPPLELHHDIRFEDVKFRYRDTGPDILDGLSLVIPKGVRLGVIGATGSGKSTLLDLLTGLLEPTAGSLLVDGLPVSGERLRAWQRSVAHVPQAVYLSDSTIAENIAFGVPSQAVDMQRVTQSAAEAQIAASIESRIGGYSALIGERGIRLSGGERQRVGIARALYKQGSVLVLDEATSALDNTTEQSVMDTIEGLKRDLTVIIIAHRVTTVRRCDRIVEYESYEHMLERSPSARQVLLAS